MTPDALQRPGGGALQGPVEGPNPDYSSWPALGVVLTDRQRDRERLALKVHLSMSQQLRQGPLSDRLLKLMTPLHAHRWQGKIAIELRAIADWLDEGLAADREIANEILAPAWARQEAA